MRLNPYKRVSVRFSDGSEIKGFETIAQARDFAKRESRSCHFCASIIVNEEVFESYDERGVIV